MRRLLISLVVLVGLLVVADRVCAYLASRQVAVEAARDAPECTPPGVDIGGFPFLTQAVAGKYDDVTLTAASCRAAVTLQPVRVTLRGVHLGLEQIVQRTVSRVPVDRARGTATIPYRSLGQEVGGGKLTFSRGPGNTILVTGTLTVAGQSVSAHGTGRVSLSDGRLRITVATVTTPAGSVDPGGAFDVTLPVPSLPFHLTGAAVSAGAAGIVLTATAHDLVLQK